MPSNMPRFNGDRRRRALLLSERLEDIAAARRNLVLQLEALDEQAKTMQHEVNVLHNIDALTSNVPDEALAMIFEAGALPGSSHWPHFGVVVSHVSSRWRRVALSTPRLWTNVVSRIHDAGSRVRALAFLERSKLAPLDIAIFRLEPDDPSPHFFQLINGHIGRCRTLRIEDAHHGMGQAIECLSNAAPLLRSINLGSGTKDREVYFALGAPLFPAGAPRLETAQLDCIDVDTMHFCLPAFISVTSLRLTNVRLNRPTLGSYIELRDALVALQSLHHLELQLDSYELIHTAHLPIILPTIRYLRLEIPPGNLDTFTCSLVASNLLVLSLERWDGQEHAFGMEDQSTHRFPSLEHLILTGIDINTPYLDAYAKRFPDIKRLTCQVHPQFNHCGLDYILQPICLGIQRYAPSEVNDPPNLDDGWDRWPNLEVIALSATDSPSNPTLYTMIKMVKRGRPLRKLMLPDTWRTDHADDMAVLGNIIQVEGYSLDWPTPFPE
ncbi:hypothetical protein HWV62_35184 [Athelia sp. TMB]|nr:hypothetical protein HWV62_35184 [Athelia sp. TMB]